MYLPCNILSGFASLGGDQGLLLVAYLSTEAANYRATEGETPRNPWPTPRVSQATAEKWPFLGVVAGMIGDWIIVENLAGRGTMHTNRPRVPSKELLLRLTGRNTTPHTCIWVVETYSYLSSQWEKLVSVLHMPKTSMSSQSSVVKVIVISHLNTSWRSDCQSASGHG
jgi:hypothetical protein